MALFALAGHSFTAAQSVVLEPPKGLGPDGVTIKPKLFYGAGNTIFLNWNKDVTSQGARLIVGLASGSYTREVLVTGTSAKVVPQNIPFTTGRYYALITNSTKKTLSEIQLDCTNNPSKYYSNEIQFIVESPSAPHIIEPFGTLTTATPRFQWDPVPGVKAYWLIISSTPFKVVTLDNGDVSVQGANIHWNYLSTGTSVQYGAPNEASPYDLPAPPLVPGVEYSYTVLNVYDDKDVSFASSAFGGVQTFTYQNTIALTPPQLLSPANNSSFYGTPKLTFQWNRVANANNYTFYLYQRVESFAGNEQQIDIPVWSTTTTNTMIEFPASEKLTKGRYVWYVVAKDNSAAGNSSLKYTFDYSQVMGSFTATAKSTADKTNIIGFELRANAIKGGVSTANPFLVNNTSSYTDSLVAGTYEFVAKKSDYHDSSFVYTILPGKKIDVQIFLRPYNSAISGSVVDKKNAAVADVNLSIKNLVTSSSYSSRTKSDGTFTLSLPKGSYSIQASKPGYLSSQVRTILVDQNQMSISTPLVVTEDNASISGKVLNDQSQSVQLATVTARQGTTAQSVNTDNEGNFSLMLSSGQWSLEVTKTGFTAPQPFVYNFAAGEVLQNKNFILTPKANLISGIVYKAIKGTGGQTGKVPFANITVKATPLSGSSITTVTNVKGEFSFSLKAGSWTITAQENGYTSDGNFSTVLKQDSPQDITALEFLLTPNTSKISGFITLPDGSGLGEAVITSSDLTYTMSLQNGYYEMSLPAQNVELRAEKDGYVTPASKSLTLQPGQELTDINFMLAPNAGTVSGRVTSNLEPVSDAVVSASSGQETFSVNTNSLGEYVLNLESGRYVISAAKKGFLSTQDLDVTVSAGQKSINNNFRLEQNVGRIEGVVVNNSQPISDAVVRLLDESFTTTLYSTKTDINGEFSVITEAGQTLRLSVTKSGYVRKRELLPKIVSGSVTSREVTLPNAISSISGKVTNAAHSPLNNVKLYFYSGQMLIDSTLTTSLGEYYMPLQSGSYGITAKLGGYQNAELTISIAAGEEIKNADLSLEENFSVLLGKVTDKDGAALSGVSVSLSGTVSANASSDSKGQYVFPRLTEGSYSAKFYKPGYSDTTVASVLLGTAQTKEVNVSLAKTSGRIFGNISSESGQPVGEATVILKNTSNNTYYALTDNSGNYSAEGLAFGTYTIKVEKPGYKTTDNPVVTISSSASQKIVNISNLIQLNAKISGVVSDEGSLPVPNAEVKISSPEGSTSTVTDNSGRYELAGLANGSYTVEAIKTGYTSVKTSVEITGQVEKNIQLIKNTARVTGSIKDQRGNAIKTIALIKTILAGSASGEVYTAYTDQSGNFVFDALPNQQTLLIFSEINKPGYVNDTIQVVLNGGISKINAVTLTIRINNSAIEGNTGLGGAAIKLTNKLSGKTQSVTSLSDGNYVFSYLPDGDYTIKAEKQGYIFSPASLDVKLGIFDTASVNFNASSNIGSIKAVVTYMQNGTPASGSKVTVINRADNQVYTSSTNASGEALFSELPALKTYIIRASLDGYRTNKDSVVQVLAKDQAATVSFQMRKNTSALSGYVLNKQTSQPISGASVSITEFSTGQIYNTQSNSQGYYIFENLGSGKVTLKAVKSGFSTQDTSYTLGDNELKNNFNIALPASSVRLSGRVLFESAGVPGVEITAGSSVTFKTVTTSSGTFTFDNLPIKTGMKDTTIYNLQITQKGYAQLTQIVKITASQLGNTISAEDFILPSGQILLNISNGQSSLEGVKVDIVSPGGQTISFITNSTGKYKTENNLLGGLYRIGLSKDGLLMPGEKSLRLTLDTDTSKIERTIVLPYLHKPLALIYADKPALVKINCSSFIPGSEAVLYFKKKSADSYKQVYMPRTDSTYEASIPAQLTQEELQYYVEIKDVVNAATYSTPKYTVASIATNMLSSMKVTPDFQGMAFRLNDTYLFELTLRNGLNESLNSKFTGADKQGSISWLPDDAASVQLSLKNPDDSTSVLVTPLKTGTINLKARAVLSGIRIEKTLSLNVIDAALVSVSVTGADGRISNKTSGIYFKATCLDTSSVAVLPGNNLVWTVEPSEAGTITQQGFFKPVDSTYIGYTKVVLTDKSTAKQGSQEFSVEAEVTPNAAYALMDKRGLTLEIPKGSVSGLTSVYMSRPQFGPAKKYYTEETSSASYTISDKVYNIKYASVSPLPGDSLLKPAEITIPVDKALEFNQGAVSLGLYDPVEKYWRIYDDNASADNSVSSNKIYKFGEFAALTANQPLGLRNLCALPNPFSPVVSPLKIGYILTSNAPPAKVTIKIYNIRGELVRTLLEDDLQYPSKYGSRVSPKEILWDAKTDDGNDVRNGRYIIQVTAKDNSAEKTELLQVVVVK